MTEQSKEYAEALFALAAETGEQEACLTGLTLVADLLADNPDYRELLANPAIPAAERYALLEQALAGAVPESVLSFLGLLCAHGRIRMLDDCLEDYRALYRASISLSTAYVTSAVALTDGQRDRLQNKLEALTGHTVVLECAVDETLLGGMTVHIDGKVLDGSLRHRLQEVKEVIEQ
ncbi:MAG: ATP synthase F1 subunit delta [Clostridia bacterium]|nr:ATP synthase F1 subunit delta [Clostridia bacterium]